MRYSSVLVTVLFLNACSWQSADSGESGAGDAGFLVVNPVGLAGPVEVKAAQPEPWQLRRQVRFPLQFCLRDSATGTALPGTAVRMEGIRHRTDHRGCFTHEVTIEHNRLSDETSLARKFTVELLSDPSASFILKAALNPWKRTVADLRYATVNALTEDPASLLAPPSVGTNLLVRSLDIEPLQHGAVEETSYLEVGLRFDAGMVRRDEDGRAVSEALTQGQLTGNLLLLEKSPDGESRSLGESEPVSLEIRSGEARSATVRVWLNETPDPKSILEWWIQLRPAGEAPGLASWEAAIRFPATQLTRRPSGSPEPLSLKVWESARTRFKSVSREKRAGAEMVLQKTEGPRLGGFVLESWEVRSHLPLEVRPEDSTATVEARVRVCVRDSLSGEPIGNHPFRIELRERPQAPSPAVEAYTDRGGCLQTTESFRLSFPYFAPEHYLKRYLTVSSETVPLENVARGVEVYLNPWHREDRLFFWDARGGSPPPNPSPERARLQVMDVAYQYPPQKDDTEIDTHLNLVRKDLFYLVLDVRESRGFTFERRSGAPNSLSPLWPGLRFRVRTLLTGTRVPSRTGAAPLAQRRLISGYETTAEVDERGLLVVPIVTAFDFEERPLLTSLSRLVLEIASESAAGPEPITVELPFDYLKDNQQGLKAVPASLTWETVREQAMPPGMQWHELSLGEEKIAATLLEGRQFRLLKPRPAEPAPPLDLFLKHVSLSPRLSRVDADRPEAKWPEELATIGFTERELEELLSSPSEELATADRRLAGFCSLYLRWFAEEPKEKPSYERDPRHLFQRQSTIQCHQPARCRPFSLSLDLDSGLHPEKPPKSLMDACRANPARFLKAHRLSFVEEVHGNPEPGETRVIPIDVMADFFLERSETSRETTGHTGSHNVDVGTTVKVGFEQFGNGITAHASYLYKNQWYSGTSRSTSDSEKNRIRIRESRALVAKEYNYRVEMTTRDCLYIRLRPGLPRDRLTSWGHGDQAYLLCRPTRREVAESWYYLNDRGGNQGLAEREHLDLREQTWIKTLRGERSFAAFKRLLEDRTRRFTLTPVPVFRGGTDSLVRGVYRSLEDPFGLFKQDAFPGMRENRPLGSPGF